MNGGFTFLKIVTCGGLTDYCFLNLFLTIFNVTAVIDSYDGEKQCYPHLLTRRCPQSHATWQ